MSAMEKLGIQSLQHHCYRELSGGQQQRVLIARALCAARKMLILDEPITGLDPWAIQDFYGLIRHLNREEGVAIFMVTHDVANVVSQADKILHLVSQADKILHLQQKALFYGTPSEYEKSPQGRKFLGGGDLWE